MTWAPNQGSDGNFIINVSGIKDPLGLRARMVGTHNATVTKNTTQDLDWLIPQLQYSGQNKQAYFDGVQYLAKNAEIGDSLKFQVVDVDGILSPAGTVLDEFGTDVLVIPDSNVIIRLYKAKFVAGLYVRVKYTSIGTVNDVKFICNVFRHLNENENV